jgi:Sec-independent protein secretion pathway component TatC
MGMIMMAGPVVVLYILSIGLAWMFGKKKKPVPEDA